MLQYRLNGASVAKAFIGIGSNIQPARCIRAGVTDLQVHFNSIRLSSVYESKAVGFNGDNFLNLVAQVDTDLSVEKLQCLCKDIERRHGRHPDATKCTPRTLDLDLLLYDDLVQAEKSPLQPQLPRPEIEFNAFVLKPLAELAPNWVHPQNKQSLMQLWQAFTPTEEQRLWPVEFDWAAEQV